jgi:hypothetical protein
MEYLRFPFQLLLGCLAARLVAYIAGNSDAIASGQPVPVHETRVPHDDGASGGFDLVDQHVNLSVVGWEDIP